MIVCSSQKMIYILYQIFIYEITYIQLEAALKAIRKDPDTNYENDENVGETEEGMDKTAKYEITLHTISEICQEKHESPKVC